MKKMDIAILGGALIMNIAGIFGAYMIRQKRKKGQ